MFRWPALFNIAVSLQIAIWIGPNLTGGDPHGRVAAAARLYEAMIVSAMASDANQENPPNVPESSFTLERE
jgi:hypothetical protein